GGEVLDDNQLSDGYYVRPAIATAKNEWDIVQKETFAPILYLTKYSDLDEAIAKHNVVNQVLISSIFPLNLREADAFLSDPSSYCAIANANVATSGAEIGGVFCVEKETGGGREAGSGAWKAYMRRQTNTINWSDEDPLAQG